MYRKIDIHVGPVLMEVKLEDRRVCDCGMEMYKHDVAVGTIYTVDIKSVRWVKFECHGCGKKQPVRIIDVWNNLGVAQWGFLDCFDLGRAIPMTPLPQKWESVKDNKVAPAQRLPGGSQLVT